MGTGVPIFMGSPFLRDTGTQLLVALLVYCIPGGSSVSRHLENHANLSAKRSHWLGQDLGQGWQVAPKVWL